MRTCSPVYTICHTSTLTDLWAMVTSGELARVANEKKSRSIGSVSFAQLSLITYRYIYIITLQFKARFSASVQTVYTINRIKLGEDCLQASTETK